LAFRTRAADLLPLVPAAAIPLVFLHVKYQAHVSVGQLDVYGSDLAVLLTVIAAAAAGMLFGWERVLAPRLLWLVAGGLLAMFAAACFWRPLQDTTAHLITLAKFAEYALLAPAAVLLFRRSVDVSRFLAVFVAWCAAASGWGLLQFLGLVNEFDGKRPGQREVSFLGHEDFGVFAGAALVLGFAALAYDERPRLGYAALAAGALGVVLDASISAYSGVVLAAVAVVWAGRRAGTLRARRVLAMAAILVVMGAGVNFLRGSDVGNYLSFLGIHPSSAPSTGVQTGSQRVLLLYIGLRIWEDHPWLGVGFERSADRYQPYLAAARRRYPDNPAQAFPSPKHPWGIQNFWLQVLADTGIPGLALAVATFAAGLLTAYRSLAGNRLVALTAAGWLLVAAGTWNAIGIVSGLPIDAVTWLGLGLAVSAQWLE
jgi:O-Antigen ligase